jgi:hypothetical protein
MKTQETGDIQAKPPLSSLAFLTAILLQKVLIPSQIVIRLNDIAPINPQTLTKS